ncbi:hypothetical protein Tco_0929075 [Tanacetum coccineum]
MTKVIKGEFEKPESQKISDDSFTCNTSLEIFHEEFNRMSRMDDDLFTYEVEISGIANIPCDLKEEDDSEQQMSHESNEDMEYDPSNARGDNEVELTDEESSGSNDEDEVAEIFKIDTNVFDFKTPMCRAFKEFNYLLQIDPDVHEKPWTDNGWPTCSWKDDGYCNGGNLPGAYIIGNTLRYQDLEWYEALKDTKLKEEALKNKAIMKGIIDEDDESSNKVSEDEEYAAIKENKYDDLMSTSEEACRAYKKSFSK